VSKLPESRRINQNCHCLELVPRGKGIPPKIAWGVSLTRGLIVRVLDRWNKDLTMVEAWNRVFFVALSHLDATNDTFEPDWVQSEHPRG
jgi:hypothetical protein